MLIDWFTVGAQALNFLILVWLMKRFLYKPILDAIDVREKRIAARTGGRRRQNKRRPKRSATNSSRKTSEFDRQRTALLSKATEEAKAERQRLLDEARKAAEALRIGRQEALKTDAHNLNQAIARRAQQEVFAIARKALTDLATVSLEERMGEVFTRRLREMNGKAKECVAGALKTASEPALLRSTFELPAEQRAAIQNALNETFAAEVRVRFETAPDLVSGIELTANGQKVAWSIADYLASLETGVGELLNKQAVAEQAHESRAGKLAKRVRPCVRWNEPGAGSLRAATDPREVGDGHERFNGHRHESPDFPGAGFEELLEFPGGVFGIAFNVDEDEIGVVLLGDYSNLHARR